MVKSMSQPSSNPKLITTKELIEDSPVLRKKVVMRENVSIEFGDFFWVFWISLLQVRVVFCFFGSELTVGEIGFFSF